MLEPMLYIHPTIIVFISAILLLLFRNYPKIFNWLLIYPVINILVLGNSSNRYDSFSIFNLNFISNITYADYQIASAFMLVTLFANTVAITNNRKWEIIIGNFANFAAFLCLFAGDFISMFIGIELLMVASTILIFMGDSQNSIKAAKQYFLTHLFSSGLILIGISDFINVNNGNTEIILLTDLINNKEQGFLFYILLCIGCLINIATVPFAGWFINCYPKSSGSGFMYLTAFSTKITIIIMIKLFSGLAILKFIGVIMIIYGSIYAYFEENLRKLLYYLIISQLGLMVVTISIGTQQSIGYIITYIPTHIYYIALFICLIRLLESIDIKSCQKIRNIKNFTFTISLFVATLMISNFPFTSSFVSKLLLSQNSLGNFIYYLVLLSNSMIFIALPFREYFTDRVGLSVSMSNYDKSILFWLILIIIIFNTILIRFYLSTYETIAIESIIQQLAVITVGIILAFIIKIPRCSTSNINLDLYQYIEKLIYFSIDKYKETANSTEDTEEYLNFKVIWDNVLSKISAWHNQQTAIFIILFLLISLILILVIPT